MAQPLPCDLCGTPVGTFMITAIATGDALSICLQCVPTWCEVIVQTLDHADDTPTEPATAAQRPVEPADDDWGDGYPQGPPRPPEAATEAATDALEGQGQEAEATVEPG